MGTFFDETIAKTFNGIFLALDSALYGLIATFYKIFVALSRATILTEAHYQQFANRINIIIGVAMLFVVAFSIIQAIVNPDNIEKGLGKIVTNIIWAIIMLALVPTAFRYAYEFQGMIVDSDVIGRLILGGFNSSRTIYFTNDQGERETLVLNSKSMINMAGNNMATTVFRAFLYDNAGNVDYNNGINSGVPISEYDPDFEIKYTMSKTAGNRYADYYVVENIVFLGDVHDYAMLTGDFGVYKPLNTAVSKSNTTFIYKTFISSVAAIFVIYVLISFCIDLGLRAVKLAFFQLIAPIPILARIVPAGKDIFTKWLKATASTFVEVFLKIAIIFFGIYLINIITTLDWDGMFTKTYPDIDKFTVFFGQVGIILGILMFMKQAPKLIKDMFGIQGEGGFGLGIKKKLQDSGALALAGMAGGAIGSGLTTGVRNAFNKKTYDKDDRGFLGGVRNVGRGVRSFLGGVGSGAARGARGNWGVKTMADFKKNTSQAIQKATDAREARDARQQSPGGALGYYTSVARQGLSDWATGGSTTEMKEKSMTYGSFLESYSKIEAEAEKKSAAGIYKTQIEELRKTAPNVTDTAFQRYNVSTGRFDTDMPAYNAAVADHQTKIKEMVDQYDKEVEKFSVGQYIKFKKGGGGSIPTTLFTEQDSLIKRNQTLFGGTNGIEQIIAGIDTSKVTINSDGTINFADTATEAAFNAATAKLHSRQSDIKAAKGNADREIASEAGRRVPKAGDSSSGGSK